MMNVGIIPRFRLLKNKNIEYAIDKKLIELIKKVFKKPKVKILFDINNEKLDYLIISGGNDLLQFSKKFNDKEREKISLHYLNGAIKMNIPVVGICYGAQLIASYFKSKLQKKSGHVGAHKITLFSHSFNTNFPKRIAVNSFHNYAITKISKQLLPLGTADDDTVEIFKHKKLKILGLMWHPERYRNYKKIDINYFKKNK